MRKLKFTGAFLVALLAVPALLGAQNTLTVEGTLVDSKCYLGMGEKDDDHGAMASCGAMCLKQGQPAGLVTADDTFHILVASSAELAGHVGHTVRITGMVKNGALIVTKAEMNANGQYSEIKLSSMM
jgi:hypothetical protein